MYEKSDAQDAKDNCIACIIRILDQFGLKFPEQEYEAMFGRVMSVIPFDADPTENETVIKFIMNQNNMKPARLEPHMEKITLTALKILIDSRLVKECSDDFKVITAKFIKNVIMQEERDQ